MKTPQWAWEAARRFWADAGGWTGDLHAAIERAGLLIRVDQLSELSIGSVRDYMRRLGHGFPEGIADRALRGCLLATEDRGWIFLDADDADDERRFSLAHELAHFLRHHLQQRRFTEGIAGRLRAALRGVPTVEYLHLIERGCGFVPPEIREAEEEADWLAVELLAPEEELLTRLSPKAERAEVEAVLCRAFGLPRSAASAHAARLIPETPDCPLIARLKKR